MAQEYVEIITYAYATAIGGSTKNFLNVYDYTRLSTVNPVNKTNIEAAFQTQVGTPLLAALSVSYTQTYTTVRFFDDALDAPQAFTEAGVGAIAGDRAPDYVCVTAQFGTGLRGRSYRGSKHWGPIAETDTLGDCLSVPAGAVTRFTNLYQAFVAGFTDADGNTWVPVVKSSKPPAQYAVNPVTVVANIIVSGKLNKSLGTMRRRKIKTVAA